MPSVTVFFYVCRHAMSDEHAKVTDVGIEADEGPYPTSVRFFMSSRNNTSFPTVLGQSWYQNMISYFAKINCARPSKY